MNLELIGAYFPVLLAAMLVSAVLSLQGPFIIQRNQSPWMLAVSQVCISGHLLAKIFIASEHGLLEFSFAAVFYFLGLYVVKKFKFADASLLALFAVFMAINYQLIALFPTLDSHLASSLFGDIATLSNQSAFVLVMMAVIYLFFHILLKKERIKSLLLKTYYLDQQRVSHRLFAFNLFAHFFLVLALFELGFLFVISFLLLPTLLLKNASRSMSHLMLGGTILSFLSAGIGLIASLSWTRLSTMPTQVSLLVIIGLLYHFIQSRIKART